MLPRVSCIYVHHKSWWTWRKLWNRGRWTSFCWRYYRYCLFLTRQPSNARPWLWQCFVNMHHYIPRCKTRLWFKCVVLHKTLCLSSVCVYVSQRDIFVDVFIIKSTGIWQKFLVVVFFCIWCNIIVKLSDNYPIDNIPTNAKPEENETTNIL